MTEQTAAVHLYDSEGHGYRQLRQPDPRLAAQISAALKNTHSVLNVGAGTGSYEPTDRPVVAVEPSVVMIGQRDALAAQVVRATATELPFKDGAFDATLAVLTLHHWPDQARGLRELRRVARERVVLLTWDPASDGWWLTDYFPEILQTDRQIFPSVAELGRQLGPCEVIPVPIPHDCVDGFLGAYWRRPEAYLRTGVRKAISSFAKIKNLQAGLDRLERDLASGVWQQRHSALLSRDTLDIGYRLLVA